MILVFSKVSFVYFIIYENLIVLRIMQLTVILISSSSLRRRPSSTTAKAVRLGLLFITQIYPNKFLATLLGTTA